MNYVTMGRAAEDRADAHLRSLGYVILARNFKFKRLGELDIVARDGDTLVFVEVKYRRFRSYGPPEASLSPRKLATIRRVAEAWMLIHRYRGIPVRFDVIAVEQCGPGEEIRHYRNAF